MPLTIRTMTAHDYPRVVALWTRTEGMGMNEADSEAAIAAYLVRNPGMSLVGETEEGEVVAAVLCGHDGRRGYLHHLAVDPPYRKQGIAARLVDRCVEALGATGVSRCNVLVFSDNEIGVSFWRHNGWNCREELSVFQKRL